MSRIEEGDYDDTASFLRGCAFSANCDRAVEGRKGQRILLELEEALLAMPDLLQSNLRKGNDATAVLA